MSEREQIHFHCRFCGERFAAVPARIEDEQSRPWHPFKYFCTCPICETEAGQASWEVNLVKAHANATGPRTEAGKSVARENIAKAQASPIARFNAIKHGLFARTATFFPARPGRYPACDGCEYLDNGCGTEHKACLKRAELYMQYEIATETKDVSLLMKLMAGNQAGIQAIISDMILSIAKSGGPELRTPVWYQDKESGRVRFVTYTNAHGEEVMLEEVNAHPLLKHLMDFIAKNSMSLADMGMTIKVQEDEKAIKGVLESAESDRETVLEFQQRQQEMQRNLLELINRGRSTPSGVVIDVASDG